VRRIRRDEPRHALHLDHANGVGHALRGGLHQG
jgi:hypothetical protein